MAVLKIELTEEERRALEDLARENATDPETLVHAHYSFYNNLSGKGIDGRYKRAYRIKHQGKPEPIEKIGPVN